MRAMVLHHVGAPLVAETRTMPVPGPHEVLVRVEACGVCRTDLHAVDGDLASPRLPLVLGHEVVGTIETCGAEVDEFKPKMRVGIPWLGHTCGHCRYCAAGHENLCDKPLFTGYTRDGGFATHVVAEAAFCFDLDAHPDPVAAAPLLCAGLIGWRCLKAAGPSEVIGLYGFGAAAHIVAQICRHQGRKVLAFTRPDDGAAQDFAYAIGASWAGGSDEPPPELLDAAIIFAPDGALVPAALKAVHKGGRVVCGGIHMTDIPSFAYDILWDERQLVSVANMTREDGREFFAVAAEAKVRTSVKPYTLADANVALDDLREGRLRGAAVLVP